MTVFSAARVRLARTATIVSVAAVAVTLAGCTGSGQTDRSTSTPTHKQSTAPTKKASSTPTPTSDPWAKVSITCEQLLTAQQIYDFNPNFGADPNYHPEAETDAAKIASHDGLACGWVNQTSGEKIEIAVGKPPASTMTSLKNRAVRMSNAVPTYGVPPAVEGYFKNAGGTGEAQVFQGDYWLVERSTAFFEPGDAAPLVADVQSNLSLG